MPNLFKVLIVDDESLARDSIRILLERRDDCQIVGEADNGKEALLKIEASQPDIVFLDIQMPKLRGLEVIKSLNGPSPPTFVMVTAFDQHALKAFDLNAIDYLLKPYSNDRFYQSLDKAIQHVNSLQSRSELVVLKGLINQLSKNTPANTGRLIIRSSGKIQFINKRDIHYIKASGNYCEVYEADKKHLMYSSISGLEDQLNPDIFVRIHRSTIVNKKKIKELESHFNGEYIIHLENGEQLKLSRSYRNKLDLILEG